TAVLAPAALAAPPAGPVLPEPAALPGPDRRHRRPAIIAGGGRSRPRPAAEGANARNRSGPIPPLLQTLWRDRPRESAGAGAEGARSTRPRPRVFQTLRQKDRGASRRACAAHFLAPVRTASMSQHAPSLRELEQHDAFVGRHIGPNDAEIATMLQAVGHGSLEALTDAIVPGTIKSADPLALEGSVTEEEALARIRASAKKNKVFRSFIGQGYYGTHTPKVILRNILENPAWYTAYTPYQAEISQGRMEALVNFQQMCADLTGMEIANASLLDEATAAAEAMTLAKRAGKSKSDTFFVHDAVHPQPLGVLRTRAEPLGITLRVGTPAEAMEAECFGILLQYPDTFGHIGDHK